MVTFKQKKIQRFNDNSLMHLSCYETKGWQDKNLQISLILYLSSSKVAKFQFCDDASVNANRM